MSTEKCTLPVGIVYQGKRHREAEVRARLVRDMIAGANDPLFSEDKGNYEVCCLASQIMSLGDIPKEEITGSLLLDMLEEDFNALVEAAETARKRAGTFREPAAESAEAPQGQEGKGDRPRDSGASGSPRSAEDGI